jgi:hypothetical protein
VTPIDKNNEPLDAILRRAMREQPGPATPDCADAESLAAYSDRSLSAPERERLEDHFADCMRCQVLLADIARAEESARGAQAAAEVPWYRRWRVALPALAAAAAVVVFVSMRRATNDRSENDQIVAVAKNQAPTVDLTERAQLPEPAAAPAAPAPPLAAPASNELAMNEPKPEEAARAQAMSGTEVHRMAGSAMAPGARAMIAQTDQGAPRTGAMQSYGAAVTGNALSSNAGYTEEAGVLATISPSDRSVTWIVGRNGSIKRLDANGNSRSLQSGVSTDLVAGAAPSSSVCWVVGRSGTILRTTDGEHWSSVAAPSMENLVAVSAGSASDATITTAGGKSFATSDGGASWHQQ